MSYKFVQSILKADATSGILGWPDTIVPKLLLGRSNVTIIDDFAFAV
jgi:hypothetical protein